MLSLCEAGTARRADTAVRPLRTDPFAAAPCWLAGLGVGVRQVQGRLTPALATCSGLHCRQPCILTAQRRPAVRGLATVYSLQWFTAR